jgi:NAD(P)-dependent dehydrogenase (short-subunit alcohol dehydrogenase family)
MAIELAKRGAKVAVNYANAVEGAEQVVKEIKALGNGADAAAFKANVGNVEESEKLMDDVVKHFGKLDICCSNSGVVSFGHFKDVTPEEFDRVFTINTRGQFFVAKAAYKRMEMGGRIILMGSITGQAKGVPKHAVYSGSKGAIETFTRCMAIGKTSPSSFHTSSTNRLQMLARRRSLSTAWLPVVSRPTCITPSAASTSLAVISSATTRSMSTPKHGPLTTVLANQ